MVESLAGSSANREGRYHRGMYYELTDHFVVKSTLADTWAFFGDAMNLPKITPPWMGFHVLTPAPIDMHTGTLIDYKVKVMGLPVKWRTRIIDWSPPRQFIDLQLRGPYTLWHHQHTFEQVDDGTACTDRVTYKVPAGGIGRLMNRFLIRKQLKEIFEYRSKIIDQTFGIVRVIQDVQIARV